jgi:hypothetical protein
MLVEIIQVMSMKNTFFHYVKCFLCCNKQYTIISEENPCYPGDGSRNFHQNINEYIRHTTRHPTSERNNKYTS